MAPPLVKEAASEFAAKGIICLGEDTTKIFKKNEEEEEEDDKPEPSTRTRSAAAKKRTVVKC